MKFGDRVRRSDDEKTHIGVIETIRPSKTAPDVLVAYVRWHKGYASWELADNLVIAGENA